MPKPSIIRASGANYSPLLNLHFTTYHQGYNHGWKVEGTKVWVPTPGRLRPAPGQRPGWVLGAGGGRPSRCEGPGYHPRKICENSDAKSCILVSTCCENSYFLPRCMQCRRGLAMRILSVCPSIRPSVRLSVRHTRALWQNGRKICPDLYTIRKNIYPSLLRRRMVGGGRPLLCEILGQPTPIGTKSPIFNQ